MTNATVGSGNIVIASLAGDSEAQNSILTNLNRDINQSQVITKNIVIDPITMTHAMSFSPDDNSESSSNGESGGDKNTETASNAGTEGSQSTGSVDLSDSVKQHFTSSFSKFYLGYRSQLASGLANNAYGIAADLENLRESFGVEHMIVPYREQDFRNIGEGLESAREYAQENLGVLGTLLTIPTQLPEGAIFTFLEEKNTDEGSYAYNKTDDIFSVLSFDYSSGLDSDFSGLELDTSEESVATDNMFSYVSDQVSDIYFYQKVTDVATTLGYGLNGISTDFNAGFGNYLVRNDDTTLRHNPTHGPVGDLIESGLGKGASWFGLEGVIAMNRIAAEDIYDRRAIDGATNLYHSQGTIIGNGAMNLYAKTFQKGVDLNGNLLRDELGNPMGPQFINQSQKFNAVGPAVLEVDWYRSALLLGEGLEEGAGWRHDDFDSIKYLAAPSNLINDIANLVTFGSKEYDSSIYIPNPVSPIIGTLLLPYIGNHDVRNPFYMESLRDIRYKPSDNLIKGLESNINSKLLH